MDGVAIALVSPREVTLLMDKPGAFDKEEVTKKLKRYKSKVSSSEKLTSLPL